MPLLKDFNYYAPQTVTQALKVCGKSKDPLFLAGGTFSLNYLKKAARCPVDVIGLKKIASLKGIKQKGAGLSIGAMTTIAELLDSSAIQKHFPSLHEACRKLGTTPIRNMATIGGNLCSRFFWVDLPCVLMSLDAKVSCVTSRGKITIGVEDFLQHKNPRKILVTDIVLPAPGLLGYYFRHTKSIEVDAPVLALAFSCKKDKGKLKTVKLVVNTAFSFPVILKETQGLFEGREPREIDFSIAKKCLANDMAQTKLDEYRMHCLGSDLGNLLGILAKP